MNWHTLPIAAVLSKLSTSPGGLTSHIAEKRLQEFGPNTVPEPAAPTILALFLSEFTSPLVYVLVLCAGLIYFFHGLSDSIIIGVVLLLNAGIGAYQEYKSQATLSGLKKLTATVAHVLRDGKEIEIPDSELVPGDVILIREGEKVPADARVIESQALRTDESSLTGESMSVDKQTAELKKTDLPVADQRNMIWKGTTVATGSGSAVVIATGAKTQIGGLALTIASLDTDVPLAKKIRLLAHNIVICVLAAVVIFFVISLIKGLDLSESLTTAVSMTVALIPEGLPVILTLVLSASVARMSTRHVLVKRLQAVEALGSASVIAVDKTGTITLNTLSVTDIITRDDNDADHALLLSILKSSTTAYLRQVDGKAISVGDPTEIAGLIAANDSSKKLPKLTRIAFAPFDYHKKYSSHILRDAAGQHFLARIGAADMILAHSNLSGHHKENIETQLHDMQQRGLRVIAIGTAPLLENHGDDILSQPHQLEFLGLIGMQDQLQHGVEDAITHAKAAGLKVVMITGDHAETATAIARKVGIFTDGDRVLTGDEIEKMSDLQLQKTITYHLPPSTSVTVFARVTPEHKLRIIQALRANDEIVAMTGDGVNDAASLVAADLGVAMGVSGTQVAKDAADIVLLDDNFRSITAAIEEGRALYLTIKNVIVYLLSSSAGEAFTLFGALLLGFASPITAAQIIWLNFVTDGFLDVALSYEPHEKNILHHKWDRMSTTLVDRGMILRSFITGIAMAIGTVFVFAQFSASGSRVASTMALTTLAAYQWFHAWNCRSRSLSLSKLSPFANGPLVFATLIVIALQLAAMYIPLFRSLLHTTPLHVSEWLICIGVASSVILVDEIRKAIVSYK